MRTLPASDAIVVGAGPAGALAALLLARAGRRVTLVDRDAFPRDKPCGDLLGTIAVGLLRRLNVELDVVAATKPLHGAFVYAPDGGRFGASGDAHTAQRIGARVIPRAIFDAALVTAALRAGATFVHGRVTGVVCDSDAGICGVELANGAILRAPLTIGADGWASVVARAIVTSPRAARDTGIAIRVYVENLPPTANMRFYIGAPGDGYGWIFPLANGRANVGLGFIRDEIGADQLHDAFDRFLRRIELHGARECGPRRAWPIPLGWRGTPVSAAGALLAGDAASLASSLSGSGIHTALASGAIAAAVVDGALNRNDFSARLLAVYARRLQPLASRLRIERWLHDAAGTPSRSTHAIRAANSIPGAGRLALSWLLSLG